MQALRIKRTVNNDVDPKQLLRAHVEQLPVERQIEFIAAAYQLMGDRIDLSKMELATTRKMMS